MLFPLKLKLILWEIALFYTNFSTNSRICEAKSRSITLFNSKLHNLVRYVHTYLIFFVIDFLQTIEQGTFSKTYLRITAMGAINI